MVCVIKQKIITYFDFQLQEPPEPLPVERSTGLFDSRSTAFQKTLLISGTLLIFCILCGIIWDIIRHIRERTKIKPHSRFFLSFPWKFEIPWFKSFTLSLSGFVRGSPEFNSSTAFWVYHFVYSSL